MVAGVLFSYVYPVKLPEGYFQLHVLIWRGVRAVYGDGLENRCRRKTTAGSNPVPSAIYLHSVPDTESREGGLVDYSARNLDTDFRRYGQIS